MADEIDRAVDEKPPVVCRLALMEQVVARFDADLGTAVDQFGELVVDRSGEDAQRAQILDAHQIVPR